MKELQQLAVSLGLIFVIIYGALFLSWKYGTTDADTMMQATLFMIVYCFASVFFSFFESDSP